MYAPYLNTKQKYILTMKSDKNKNSTVKLGNEELFGHPKIVL